MRIGNIGRYMLLALAGGLLAAACPGGAWAQVQTLVPPVEAGAKPVTVERIKVHSKALEGNLEGLSPDRDVFVMLPPSYFKEPARRYPVVYALHGYSIDAEQWLKEIHAPQTIEGAFAKGVPEMIVVFPSSKNATGGPFYSSSVTTGDFENFIAEDLIDYIDGHYRTLARRESRGLVGHSMGGYGAARIGIKRADKFGALYVMSACCIDPMGSRGLTGKQVGEIEAIKSLADAPAMEFLERGTIALAAAWSPNPNKPPLYIDLPVDKDGKERPEILAKWTANAPLAFLDQYIYRVRQYAGIAIDVGDRDPLKDEAKILHDALLAQGIANSLEIYDGDHTDHVPYRIQDHVLPFFGRYLVGDGK